MELLIRDEDVVSMVLEFLHSRKFYESAVALERESGVCRTAEKLLPDQLQYLRRLCLDGDCDNVLYLLQPLTEIDESITRKLNRIVLTQKYIEVLHLIILTNEACSGKNQESLKKIFKDLQSHCTEEELRRTIEVFKWFSCESGSLAAFRVQCFQDLVEIVAPFYTAPVDDGETYQWMYEPQEDARTRLDSVVADSLYLNECKQYCRNRASKSDIHHHPALPTLSTKTLLTRGNDVSSCASVLFWVRSLNDDELFRQRFEIEDVQLKTKGIVKQKLPPKSPKMFSSFVSPTKQQKEFIPEAIQPAVVRSVQLPSERSNAQTNLLASSSPGNYLQYSERNFSNNNNNNENAVDIQGSEALETGGTSEHTDKPPAYEVIPVVSENTPRSAQSHTGPDRLTDANQNSVEKHLGFSSILKMESSYENFIEEKRKKQMEKEQFLKNLEEREKRNQEIRKLLMQQPTESTDNVHRCTSAEPAAHQPYSDVQQENQSKYNAYDPANLAKCEYICIEYTEDVQAVRAVTFHPSGQVYAVGSNSKTLRICKVPREVTAVQSDENGHFETPQELKDHSPKSSEIVAKMTNVHKGSVYCAAWNDDGSLIATGSNDKLIKLIGFDILAKTLEEVPQQMSLHRGIVRDVTFLYESNNILASGSADGMVCISDCKYSKLVHNLAGHSDQVLGLYSWHRGLLASASQDKCVRLWDVRTPSCISIIGVGEQNPCFATSVCVDNSGRWMAMGLNNAKVAIYDLNAGKMTFEYKCHSDEVRCVRFNPVLENLLLSSSYDGTLVITDVEGLMREAAAANSSRLCCWKEVGKATNKLIQCKWHPNGDAFASTSVNQTCNLWLRLNS